ncbi:MAG TPA: glycoside hydrolase family 125 protein [Firmicutes bacterium]|nr:glycoside hydrolase family 125 protein [Bacillota bacterium]
MAGLPMPGGELVVPFTYVRAAGEEAWQGVELGELRWDREEDWLPGWTAEGSGLRMAGRLFAPAGHRGAVYRLTATNLASAPVELTLGLGGTWAETRQTLFSARPVAGEHQAWHDEWTQALVLECRPGLALLGWALGCDRPLSTCVCEEVPVQQAAADSSLQLELAVDAFPSPSWPWRRRLGRRDGRAVAGGCLRFYLGTALPLNPGESREVAFFLGVGTDGDGARLTLVDLRRRGAEALHAATRRDLAARALQVDPSKVRALLAQGGQAAGETEAQEAATRLTSLLRRNLHFNRHFAAGRALDTGRLALVTSRSPGYYVKGAFWARDAFLWSFPGLLLADRRLAREALVAGLTRYVEHGPFHACYLDGRPLYPGFELDELAAPLWAFDHYLEVTGDDSLWAEPGVAEGLRLILRRFQVLAAEGRQEAEEGLEPELRPWREGRGLLLPTFLDPTDDPVPANQYLTYGNVLAWRALDGFARRAEKRRGWEEERRRAGELAEALRRGIEDHLIYGRPPRRSFVQAASGPGGGLVMGDNPAGSLALLAHLGFRKADDPEFLRTLADLNSPANPCYFPGPFAGRGNRHAPFPWVIARAADLLARDASALRFFLDAPLDDGLACESVDPRTGAVKTGAAFAAAAGWLAWCLYRALGG